MISVIVPVYKVEPYLDRCARSLVGQTHKDLEIILVDDGSPDNCPALCDAWAQKDGRIRVIHKKNGGLSDARNAGLDLASGDYIGFVDGDDWVSVHMFGALLDTLEKTGADIAECARLDVGEGETPEDAPLLGAAVTACGAEEALEGLLNQRVFSPTVWNKLYARRAIGDLRFEKGKQHEDVFFTYRALGGSARVARLDAVGYYYLRRGDGIMGTGFSLKSLDALEACEGQLAYMAARFPRLIFQAKSNLFFMGLYLGQQALRAGDRALAERALGRIRDFQRRAVFSGEEQKRLGAKQALWYRLARVSLKTCCTLRNRLRVGL